MEPTLRSAKIAIIGGAVGRDSAIQYKDTEWEVWCVARIYKAVRFATFVFDMHQDTSRWTSGTQEAYRDSKLILHSPQVEFPNAYLIPADHLEKKFNTLTSSFSWMVAYALHRGATDIALCGVNMSDKSELAVQRPGLFYLLGYARANEVRISTPRTSQLRTDIRFLTN